MCMIKCKFKRMKLLFRLYFMRWLSKLYFWKFSKKMNFTQLFIAIFGYTYLIISVIGFITNLISFIILSSKTFRNTVFSSYFRFIAFFNILSMIIPINKFLEYNLNIWIRDFSDSLCKFRMYYFYILFPVYCWGLVSI